MTRKWWTVAFAALIVSPEPVAAAPGAVYPAPCDAVVSKILAAGPSQPVRVRISLFDAATSRLRTGQADLGVTPPIEMIKNMEVFGAPLATGSVLWSDDSGSATVHLSAGGITLDAGEGKHLVFAPACAGDVVTGTADTATDEAIALSVIERQ